MEPTKSFWLNHSPYEDFQSTPELPRKSEVVVIGGGITGVSTAYWLRNNSVEVTLLEQRGLSGGATGRNAGGIAPGPAGQLSQVVKRYGPETARDIWNYTYECAQAIKQFAIEHQVDCNLSFSGRVILALSPVELSQLQDDADFLTKYGRPVEYWDAATCAQRIHSTAFRGGLFSPEGGSLWPAKLVFGVAEQALRLGTNIQTQTEVHAIESENNRLIVKTARGNVQAQHVVYATNAWTRHLLPDLSDTIIPVRGQIVITQPVLRLWPYGLSTNFGYEYWGQRTDGRIVLGGMRWLTSTREENNEDDTVIEPVVSKALHEFLPKHFPELQDVQVEQEWTGIMGFTPERHPLIGPLSGRPGEYIAAGFSGHGMSVAFYAGKTVAEMIVGQEPESFVEAFLPMRFAEGAAC